MKENNTIGQTLHRKLKIAEHLPPKQPSELVCS